MVCWSMANSPAVAPYSGVILAMVARSPTDKLSAPSPKNSTNAPTTRSFRKNSVNANTISVAVMSAWRLPTNSTPTISGVRNIDGKPNITHSASKPPTPTEITPNASTCGVCESVPTQVSGNATPFRTCTTGDIFSKLIWCIIPLPAGITSTFSNAVLVQLMKWKRSSLRRSSISRFFWNASGSKPPHSTANEWSTINCVCTTGLTLLGSPPFSAIASRKPAKSTKAVCPKISWHTTRAGYHGKSNSCLLSISCFSQDCSVALSTFWARLIKFSAKMRLV